MQKSLICILRKYQKVSKSTKNNGMQLTCLCSKVGEIEDTAAQTDSKHIGRWLPAPGPLQSSKGAQKPYCHQHTGDTSTSLNSLDTDSPHEHFIWLIEVWAEMNVL